MLPVDVVQVDAACCPSKKGRGAVVELLSTLPMSVLVRLVALGSFSFQYPSVTRMVKFCWQEYCIGSATVPSLWP